MKRNFLAGVAMCAFLMAVSACTSLDSARPAAQNVTIIVRGSLLYRQRIALHPGSVANVTLSDVSIADRPADVIASQAIPLEGRQVPVAFQLTVDRSSLRSGRRYSVRGTITNAEGELLWTTDTVHSVDINMPIADLGSLMLVPAR